MLAAWALATGLVTPRLEGHLRRQVERDPSIQVLRRGGARVEVAGQDVALTSDFDPPAALSLAARIAIASIGGIRHVRTETAVAVMMVPFRFTVRRDAERLTLEGGSPPGDLHGHLVDLAAAASAGRVRDRLAPSLGAPAGFEAAAEIVLRVATQLASGEVSVIDGLVAVEGNASDFAHYNGIVASLNELPVGFTLGPFDVVPPQARPFSWAVTRDGGVITLSGHVPSEQAREALRAIAVDGFPGLQVTDTMQTARGLDGAVDLTAVAHLAMATLSRLDSGRVQLDGGRLAVTGRATARDLLEELAAGLKHDVPRGVQLAAIDLTPIAPTPYVFVADRTRNAVALSGFVPGLEQREALNKLAQRRAADQPVVDGLHFADGAPDGFRAAAEVAVGAVAELAEGRAAVSDRSLVVTGRSLYPGVAGQLRDRVTSGLPTGWSGEARIVAEPYEKSLEAAQCGDLLTDLARREPLRFEGGKSEIGAKARATLLTAAALLGRCGPVRVKVTAQVASPTATGTDAARELADRRAAAIIAALDAPGSKVRLSAKIEVTADKGAARVGEDNVTLEVEP